jgi:hypothetical protein
MIPWKSRRRCGARVIVQPWQGFGPQKNFAVAHAAHDWVLCLDADERVHAGARHCDSRGARFGACRRRVLRWRGATVPRPLAAHGEGYPDWIVRLFDRRHARWTDDPVHENVTANGSIARLSGDLLHASAESHRRVHRQAEPVHDDPGRGDAHARRARERRCGSSARPSRDSSGSTS